MRVEWCGVAHAPGARSSGMIDRRAFIQRLVAPTVVLLAAACSQAAPAPSPTTAPAPPAPAPTAPAAAATSAPGVATTTAPAAPQTTTAPAAAPTRPATLIKVTISFSDRSTS